MNINDLTNREAMGLAKYYVSSVKDNLQRIYTQLSKLNQNELVKIVENEYYHLKQRYVAGQILSLIGDPRISTFNPTMIDIPAMEVEIGINGDQIDSVLKNFEKLNLKREWILKETPKFVTKIDKFRVSKYLITNQEFRDFLEDTKFEGLPSSWEFGIYPEHKANHPVYSITYIAACEFIKWLSGKTNRKFRFLSEFEWEYAASGTNHYEYPWGNKYLDHHANTLETGFFSSTPIGIFPNGNSEFGICDFAGNVEEYVSSYYKPYLNSNYIKDDIAVILGKYKVCRGGSFSRYADLARCTRRHGAFPKDIYLIGFRLAESILK